MKNRYISQTLSLLLVGAVLCGCADTVVKPVATEPDVVSERIAAAAEKAARSLSEMSSIEQVRTPLPSEPTYTNAPSSMTQIITVKWTGPIEQIIKTLATRAGLSFHVKGNPPPVPLVVNVDAYQQPLVQVLRDLGLQAGRRADLSVDGRFGVIEIRYAPIDR